MHTSWSRFFTVNHGTSASNYQLFNMKQPRSRFEPATSEVEFEASTIIPIPLSALPRRINMQVYSGSCLHLIFVA